MPPALHRHLKRGLDLGCRCHGEPDAAIEDVPRERCRGQEYEAKRRRIEAIAADYLRGRPPLLLSAGLRGPFNNGWKNPWASTRPRRRSSTQSSATVAATSPGRTRCAPKAKTMAKDTVGVRPAPRKKSRHGARRPFASPEAFRAPSLALSVRGHDGNLMENEVEVEIPPPTASSPIQHDVSEFFSDNNETTVQPPFWLRRRESERRRGARCSLTPNPQVSPARSRSRRAETAVGGKRRAGPATPVHQHWSSSASASMMISSPAHRPGGLAAAADQAATPNSRSSHSTPTASPSPHASDNGNADPPMQQLTSCKTLATVLARDHVVRRHDLVASPAPLSSTGFRYRKVLGPRSKNGEKQKPKARAMDFNSSPAGKKTASASIKHHDRGKSAVERSVPPVQVAPEKYCAHLDLGPVQNDTEARLEAVREDMQDQPEPVRHDTADALDQPLANKMIVEQQHPQHDTDHSSHPSAMSTQAAMLLAQLEFQESTYRTLSPPYAQEWSPTSRKSPRPVAHQASPAVTPLSVFSSRLDGALPNGSVLRGAPISTQDLFGAASPFAFSTIKKKAVAPPGSGLRSELAASCGYDAGADAARAKSPTPSAERIPLKAKGNNTTPSLWGFVGEKRSQASQESLVDRTRKCVSDVELPRLDLDTSLDDLEANSGLLFTDGVLRSRDASCIEPT